MWCDDCDCIHRYAFCHACGDWVNIHQCVTVYNRYPWYLFWRRKTMTLCGECVDQMRENLRAHATMVSEEWWADESE